MLIDPRTLNNLLQTRSGLALLDVREHGEYNAAHIPGASSLPRRLLEFRLTQLVPCRTARLVLCDDDGRRATLAAETARRMGYAEVSVLDGGVNRWSSLGLPTEWGMNVPSKDFGERVEVQHEVPTVEASELADWQRRGEQLLILDTRTPEEYRQYCIPGGRNVPGGELAFRITDLLRENPDARVVVNCAGRTRSIIGTRALQRMGLPNVVSLKNGTSGWVLAGLTLEQGADRTALPPPSDEGRARAERFARQLAREDGVRSLSIGELQTLLERRERDCTYLLDVRTEQEFSAGHIPGFWWFPGGQAVQRADDAVAVRDATIVFACDGLARATITASWYRQLGFPNVVVVDGGTTAWQAAGLELETGHDPGDPFGYAEAVRRTPSLEPAELATRLESQPPAMVLFVDTSREFASGHPPGARWLSRSWLELQIETLAPDRQTPLVTADADGRGAALAASTLSELGYQNVAWLRGGVRAWRESHLSIEQGLTGVMRPPDDVVPAGPERSYADMIHYLRWEEALGRKYES